MTSRIESAAKTRRALLDAASDLLDAGGPEAVTLREVGARAGVSRNAPYRHFADKEGLLAAVAVEGWDRLADTLDAIGLAGAEPSTRLRRALTALVELGRQRPHLYQLMFISPERDLAAAARAATRAQQRLLSIVAGTVGEADAPLYGALLFSSAHGMAGLEIGGHLAEKKWGVSTEDLIAAAVALTGAVHAPNRAD
jgi:AcrR family transcriptional regulator